MITGSFVIHIGNTASHRLVLIDWSLIDWLTDLSTKWLSGWLMTGGYLKRLILI